HPTAALCFLLYLTHGIRRVYVPRETRVAVAEHILSHVIESRSLELVPRGPLRLKLWRLLPGAATIGTSGEVVTDRAFVLETCRLGAQAWALGESAFFFSHRLLTERHGPYEIGDDLMASCRHIGNLDLLYRVWPGLRITGDLPSQL